MRTVMIGGSMDGYSRTPQLTIPGLAMREGDFGALCASYSSSGECGDSRGTQLYNPFTGNFFPYNKIVISSRIVMHPPYWKYGLRTLASRKALRRCSIHLP